MPVQSVTEARGLVNLALARIEVANGTYHRGAVGHLKAARVQLEAASTLLAVIPPKVEDES